MKTLPSNDYSRYGFCFCFEILPTNNIDLPVLEVSDLCLCQYAYDYVDLDLLKNKKMKNYIQRIKELENPTLV